MTEWAKWSCEFLRIGKAAFERMSLNATNGVKRRWWQP